MQEELDRQNERSRRFFQIFNFGWLVVSVVSLTYSATATFSAHPDYLHEWRAPVIFTLMFLVIAFFGILPVYMRKRAQGLASEQWPPSLTFSLPYWTSLYLVVTALSILDNSFAWSYFVVLGLTFATFNGKSVIALTALIFLGYCWFAGLLGWPLSGSNLGATLGILITFTSITLMCVTIQHLTRERHERDCVLRELARSNAELEEAHRRLAETTAQEQELAVLRERTRLAREMHDTLGHALVLVSVKLEAAQRLRERDPQRCDQELEATKEIVRDSMKELRASIANLRSPALEREPACRALSRYAREMAQRSGLRISYDLHPDIEGLPETVEETLWKVGQEALTNIEKHAQARNVLLHISRQDGQIFMKIEDDGVGLPPGLCQQHAEDKASYESPAGHYGLNGMLERVKNARGQFSIRPNKDHGLAVEVILPLVETPLISV